jgi:hypothetical protein
MEKKNTKLFKKRIAKAKKQVFAVRALKKSYGTIGVSGFFDSLSEKKETPIRKTMHLIVFSQ